MLCGSCGEWFAALVAEAVKSSSSASSSVRKPGWSTVTEKKVSAEAIRIWRSCDTCALCAKLWILLRLLTTTDKTLVVDSNRVLTFWMLKSKEGIHPQLTFRHWKTDNIHLAGISLGVDRDDHSYDYEFTFQPGVSSAHSQFTLEFKPTSAPRLISSQFLYTSPRGLELQCATAFSSVRAVPAPVARASEPGWKAHQEPYASRNSAPGGLRASPDREYLSPSSRERLALITKWLGVCDALHKNCKVHAHSYPESDFVPHRLVSIGATKSETRLLSTDLANITGPVRYATLSHCWGSSSFLTLKLSNVEEFYRSIPEERLTRTIQEAISLCRYLGVYYLWVDSLCIIQEGDGLFEWAEQSSKMHLIYGNSYINLAASASKDGSEGLLRPFNPVIGASLAIKLPDQFWLAEDLPPRLSYEQDFIHSPLHRRGWVLQELFLSRRTLHFTNNQMVWQCKSVVHNESQPKVHISDLPWTFPFPYRWGLSNLDLDSHWTWATVNYSGSELTFHGDKLVALHGLATTFEKQYRRNAASEASSHDSNSRKYAFGCWLHNLPKWLMWTPVPPRTKRPAFNQPELVPSWSWLSFDGKISWSHFSHSDPYAKILVQGWQVLDFTNLTPLTTVGDVPGRGMLQLEAPTFTLKLESRPSGLVDPVTGRIDKPFKATVAVDGGEFPEMDITSLFIDFSGGAFKIWMDYNVTKMSFETNTTSMFFREESQRLNARLGGKPDLGLTLELRCVLLGTRSEPEKEQNFRGLVLEPASLIPDSRVYRRAGYLDFSHPLEKEPHDLNQSHYRKFAEFLSDHSKAGLSVLHVL